MSASLMRMKVCTCAALSRSLFFGWPFSSDSRMLGWNGGKSISSAESSFILRRDQRGGAGSVRAAAVTAAQGCRDARACRGAIE